MNDEIAGSNQRLTIRDDSDSAARQGATIAFNHNPRTTPHVNPQFSAATAAALASTSGNRHAELRRMEAESEPGPEVGSVKDKIGRLSATSSLSPAGAGSRGRKPVPSLAPTTEQIAARLAASRSPDRRLQTTTSDAAKFGAIRSAGMVQPQAPLERHELPSPTAIRPDLTRNSPIGSALQDDSTGSDPDSGIGRSSVQQSRAGHVHDQTPSPRQSTSTRNTPEPPETKPKLPPRSTGPPAAPPRKPMPTGHPLRATTPSMVSISGQSHNSSSSTADELGGMSEEALSNAIVASSLASSRASPATAIPPPLPTRRRAGARSILHLTHTPTSDLSRTPSPHKGMPQTLRGTAKNDDDTDHHRRHRLLHKHPHKHHEGDRKRWRQEVTEKERKRYEGVWASNKGLFIPSDRSNPHDPDGAGKWPPPRECVLNLVVREVWSRSRLPPAALAQVWDLVDHRQIGLLTKEEFVVGMWLIDQQLKGHKLPVKVPESVWDSVRYVTGIKLSSVTRE